ncbi:MAG: hypothetical protein NVSMB52_08120 [Chloroflexota bacterium]
MGVRGEGPVAWRDCTLGHPSEQVVLAGANWHSGAHADIVIEVIEPRGRETRESFNGLIIHLAAVGS